MSFWGSISFRGASSDRASPRPRPEEFTARGITGACDAELWTRPVVIFDRPARREVLRAVAIS